MVESDIRLQPIYGSLIRFSRQGTNWCGLLLSASTQLSWSSLVVSHLSTKKGWPCIIYVIRWDQASLGCTDQELSNLYSHANDIAVQLSYSFTDQRKSTLEWMVVVLLFPKWATVSLLLQQWKLFKRRKGQRTHYNKPVLKMVTRKLEEFQIRWAQVKA